MVPRRRGEHFLVTGTILPIARAHEHRRGGNIMVLDDQLKKLCSASVSERSRAIGAIAVRKETYRRIAGGEIAIVIVRVGNHRLGNLVEITHTESALAFFS